MLTCSVFRLSTYTLWFQCILAKSYHAFCVLNISKPCLVVSSSVLLFDFRPRFDIDRGLSLFNFARLCFNPWLSHSRPASHLIRQPRFHEPHRQITRILVKDLPNLRKVIAHRMSNETLARESWRSGHVPRFSFFSYAFLTVITTCDWFAIGVWKSHKFPQVLWFLPFSTSPIQVVKSTGVWSLVP